MAWPTNKREYIERINGLCEANQDDTIRPEQKRQNLILLNAFRTDLRRIMENENE